MHQHTHTHTHTHTHAHTHTRTHTHTHAHKGKDREARPAMTCGATLSLEVLAMLTILQTKSPSVSVRVSIRSLALCPTFSWPIFSWPCACCSYFRQTDRLSITTSSWWLIYFPRNKKWWYLVSVDTWWESCAAQVWLWWSPGVSHTCVWDTRVSHIQGGKDLQNTLILHVVLRKEALQLVMCRKWPTT